MNDSSVQNNFVSNLIESAASSSSTSTSLVPKKKVILKRKSLLTEVSNSDETEIKKSKQIND